MSKINKKELIKFFLMESEEHFENIFNGLNILVQDINNWSILEEIFRSTHTLKGSSAMVEFNNFSTIAHALENLLESMKVGDLKRDKETFMFLLGIYNKLFEHLRSTQRDVEEEERDEILRKIEELESEIGKTAQKDGKIDKKGRFQGKSFDDKKLVRKIEKDFPVRSPDIKSFLRIDIDKIDFLINLAGELIVSRNKQNEMLSELLQLSKELEYAKNRLVKILDVFREKYQYSMSSKTSDVKDDDGVSDFLFDFYEGELDRYSDINVLTIQLLEVGNDISSILAEFSTRLSSFQNDINYINRVTNSLERNLTGIKLIPVKNLFNTAIRVATITATNENKNVEIVISGEQIELDKSVLDLMSDAFLHLVRNAISHGIESEDERVARGKEPTGTLYLRAQRSGTSIIFEIEDDGRGIDINRVKRKAVELGLISEYEANSMRMDDIIQYIFQPGFSTSKEITDVAGRGVGLDVVKRIVENLGGTVSVYTEKGKFTKFVLVIPVTQFIAEYLIVREEKHIFAIPLRSVYEIIQLNVDNIKRIGDHFFYNLRNEIYEIVDLLVTLGVKNKNQFKNDSFGILVDGPQKKYIIQVEEIVGRETTVTKKFSPFMVRANKFIGTSISAKGEVRLILDTVRLFSSKIKVRDFEKVVKDDEKDVVKFYSKGVLVVDDSISVRRYLSEILRKSGYRVVEAKDGLDALSILEHSRFPYILTDLEMPNINGYELINKIRSELGDENTKIFVITSRGTEKHKEKAIELGADGFIVKPFVEDTILKALKRQQYESLDV